MTVSLTLLERFAMLFRMLTIVNIVADEFIILFESFLTVSLSFATKCETFLTFKS